MNWYCLIHNIPPKPLYLRQKIRQRLDAVGAIALKQSVYILPLNDESLEDFQWLAQEIQAGGGTAFVSEMSFVDKAQERAAIEQFRAARAEDYSALANEIRQARRSSKRTPSAELPRLRRRFEEIRAIDFFSDKRQKEVAAMLEKIPSEKQPSRRKTAALVGKTWVTRRGVKVDRIATAWLVRRFIDSEARFRLIDPAEFTKEQNEVTFDMQGADFTHQGDRCTFETLLSAIDAKTTALQKVAEIVHDIDLKDSKYGRPETPGVQSMINGLLQSTTDDDQRFARGFELFDQLHESFSRRKK